MDQIFDINRFGNLFWRSIVQYKFAYIRIGFICLATFIILCCCSFVIGAGSMTPYKLMVNFLIITSPAIIFFKRRTHTSHIFEFILPSSVTEKFLVKLLSYILIFPAFLLVLSFILIGVAKVMPVDFISGAAAHLYTLLIDGTIGQYLKIIVAQSIYLCGSYFFKDSAFLKTVLIIMGFFVIAQIMTVIGVLFMLDFFSGNTDYKLAFDYPSLKLILNESYIKVLLIIIQYLIPIGLWFASFYKYKETEI